MTVDNAFVRNPKPGSFKAVLDSDTVSDPASRTAYWPGDAIKILAKAADKTITAPIIQLPGPFITSNECGERHPVRFLVDVEKRACVQQIANLEQECRTAGSTLDPAVLAENLWIGSQPSVVSADDVAEVVAVDVELQQLDQATGLTTALSAPFPAYYPRPVTTSTNGTVMCQGALLSIAYTLHHDGNGRIKSATALLTVGDVAAPSDQLSVRLTQTFSLQFVSDASIATRSLERGNIQQYDRSGNPGYQLHLPVRVGRLEASSDGRSAISELVGGLSLPPLGDCVDTSKVGSRALFGEDVRLSCSISLTASEFETLCRRETPTIDPALQVNVSHVASFGNADPFLLSEWLAIEYDTPTRNTATFHSSADGVELTCTNLVTSLHFELLVAPVGAANDAQDKIIAARATHGRETWRFWRRAGDTTKTTRFFLTTTVTFVTVRTTTLQQWIPPTPPIWFSIPNDVFYPFLLNSGAASTSASLWTVMVIVTSALIMA
ncbi:hypothetical protein PINS_up012679 [Pythium insidiosum]|nr:hypothetical protein PINS_up012679 [Pythium insidiosum]